MGEHLTSQRILSENCINMIKMVFVQVVARILLCIQYTLIYWFVPQNELTALYVVTTNVHNMQIKSSEGDTFIAKVLFFIFVAVYSDVQHSSVGLAWLGFCGKFFCFFLLFCETWNHLYINWIPTSNHHRRKRNRVVRIFANKLGRKTFTSTSTHSVQTEWKRSRRNSLHWILSKMLELEHFDVVKYD